MAARIASHDRLVIVCRPQIETSKVSTLLSTKASYNDDVRRQQDERGSDAQKSSLSAVFICQQSYLLLIGIPSPTHSFFPFLKPSFSANPSHCSPSFFFFRIHYMVSPDCLLLFLRISDCRVAANTQIKPIDSGCESAEYWQLPSTSTIAIVIQHELILILPSNGGWKAEST